MADDSTETPNVEGPTNTSNASSSQDNNADDDLDALLDDALGDFDKPIKKISKENVGTAGQPKNDGEHIDPMFDEDVFLKMTEGWDEVLQEMAREDPQMMSEFQKFQQNFAAGMASGAGNENNFDENISKTFNDLTANLNGLDMNEGIPNFEEMMNELKDMDGSDAGGEALMGMMQGMMENLLSKELLYPSLKDIKEKYPSWLEKNRSRLRAEELKKYKKQEEIVCKLCQLFEEDENDSSEEKEERTNKIVNLMQQMQIYGQPPQEMMDEIAAEAEASGTPPPQAPPGDCCVM